jgi:hypothetical protein
MTESPRPELRASDADRERAAETLRHAAGDGRLTLDELGDRLEETYAARTRAELATLTADLQAHDDAQPDEGYLVRRGEGGARWLLAILGGCERSGRWRLGERCTVVNVMGGSDLDLNEVELAADRVQLTVISLMGGADIHVPHGLTVEVSQFAFMGGNSVHITDDRPATPGGPVLRVRLFSVMGGSDVKRGPKLSWIERKALERQRRRELGR